jgi:hypothetical protein
MQVYVYAIRENGTNDFGWQPSPPVTSPKKGMELEVEKRGVKRKVKIVDEKRGLGSAVQGGLRPKPKSIVFYCEPSSAA